MKIKQQIKISEDAYNYLIQYGSLSYVANRLLRELKENVVGLPNVRPVSRASCKRNNLTIDIPDHLAPFVQALLDDARSPSLTPSPSYVYFSFDRLLEWAAGTEYPIENNWPIVCSNPRLEFALGAVYTLSNDELRILRSELIQLEDTDAR